MIKSNYTQEYVDEDDDSTSLFVGKWSCYWARKGISGFGDKKRGTFSSSQLEFSSTGTTRVRATDRNGR